MTDDELRAYAKHLIQGQATDRDYLSIFEGFEEWGPDHDLGEEIEEDDARKVDDLMSRAVITVTFPDAES